MSDDQIDALAAMAAVQPDKMAIVDDRPGEAPRQLTYAELNRYVNRLANGLRQESVQPDDKIMWLGQNSIEVSAFSHAARKIGAVTASHQAVKTPRPTTAPVLCNHRSILVLAMVMAVIAMRLLMPDLVQRCHFGQCRCGSAFALPTQPLQHR